MRDEDAIGASNVPDLKKLGQGGQEALVLALEPDGDTQRPLAAERRAGAHEHAALGQAAHDLALLGALREVEPDEVRLRLRRIDAEAAQALGQREALGEVALDAPNDLVLVVERGDR